MAVHRLGGTAVVMEHFDPAEALAVIERYGVSTQPVVPTMFIRMLKLPADVRQRHGCRPPGRRPPAPAPWRSRSR